MGANQSGEPRPSSSANQQGGILLVNPRPGQIKPEASIVLPERAPPILSLGQSQIDSTLHKPNEHQLDQELWVDLVNTVNEFAKSRSELTAGRQSQLQEKIVQVDEHVQKFTGSYVNGKHKALARMNEDSRKIESINKLLDKCSTQSELCVNMLNKLNVLLPEGHKLEPLEPG